MKLKTTVDLEFGMHVGDVKKVIDEDRVLGSDWTTSIILAGDLKKEAIKWIKEKRAVNNLMEDFRKFLNITENDLK